MYDTIHNCFRFALMQKNFILCSQILQNVWINDVAHWKFWRKYQSLSYLFSCMPCIEKDLIFSKYCLNFTWNTLNLLRLFELVLAKLRQQDPTEIPHRLIVIGKIHKFWEGNTNLAQSWGTLRHLWPSEKTWPATPRS